MTSTMLIPKRSFLERGSGNYWTGNRVQCIVRHSRFTLKLHTRKSMDKRLKISAQDQIPVHLPVIGIGKDPCVWWSSSREPEQKIEIGKQIFCNRSLNMKNIVAVGFDMDYTLAQYKPDTFETLAYEGTVRKLVSNLGYPEELLKWSFDWEYMVRGLVLDKKRGNILKMDRHKYVKVAYHGFKELSKEDKVGTYGNTLVRNSFDEPDYALVDTLFSLAEAYLFAQLVDFMDSHPGEIPEHVEDGTLKQMVAKDPKRYINEDPSIVPILQMLKASGRSVFLVTNSLWDYTNIVMNFLCGPPMVDGRTNFGWLQYFDVVITGSAKPSFFHEENRVNLFEVEPETGMLVNTDNGSPMPQVGDITTRLPELRGDHKVFQGGSVAHLHKILSVASSSQDGEQCLLSQNLRRKSVSFGNQEIPARGERDRIEDEVHHLKWSLKFKNPNDIENPKISSKLDKLELEIEKVRSSHQETLRKLHQRFHEVWGQLMKTGYQNSRFAHQVERFACLYTSQVSNLGLYSPDKYYRTSEDFMPHEFNIVAYDPRDMEIE